MSDCMNDGKTDPQTRGLRLLRVPHCTRVSMCAAIHFEPRPRFLAGSEHRQLSAVKTSFGRSPRVHWEGRGQAIFVCSPRRGTGCEEIVGNVNNRSNRGGAAAAEPPECQFNRNEKAIMVLLFPK